MYDYFNFFDFETVCETESTLKLCNKGEKIHQNRHIWRKGYCKGV
jgi:hypothetical protein